MKQSRATCGRMPGTRQLLGMAASVALLSGCAISERAGFNTVGNGIDRTAAVMLSFPEAPNSRERAVAHAIRETLDRQGVTIADTGRYRLEFALSQRKASVALAGKVSDEDIEWLSTPRETYPLDGCDAIRTRIVIVAYDLAASTRAYRAEAEQDGCDFDAGAVSGLASEMISKAIKQN